MGTFSQRETPDSQTRENGVENKGSHQPFRVVGVGNAEWGQDRGGNGKGKIGNSF